MLKIPETQKHTNRDYPGKLFDYLIREVTIDDSFKSLNVLSRDLKAFNSLNHRIDAYYNVSGLDGGKELEFTADSDEKTISVCFKGNLFDSLECLRKCGAISAKTYGEALGSLKEHLNRPLSDTSRSPSPSSPS
jgi:hypothetical protein